MPDNYDNLTREQLIGLLRKRDLARRLGLVWERDEIEHEKALTGNLPLLELDEGLSRGPGPWRDLLIEGDNFPALRFLRAAFKGRVKCIYIDPPYNTGNRDFVYNDRYLDPDDEFRSSTWLEFLYRRLSLARDLLRDDGALLVSINDENRAYLELLLAQIWPGGRRGSLVWRNRQGSNADQDCFLSVDHEHVLVFAGEGFRFRGFEKSYDMYSNPDDDPRGDWRSDNLTLGFSYLERPNLYYPILDPKTGVWYPANPDSVWRYASEKRIKKGQQVATKTMEEFIKLGQILFPADQRVQVWESKEKLMEAIEAGDVPKVGKNNLLRKELPDLDFWVGKKAGFGRPQFKRYKTDLRNERQPLSSWIVPKSEQEVYEVESSFVSGTNQEGAKAIVNLLGEKAFNYPKPPSLLRGLVDQSTGPGDIVLDFFAGSATTAQAVSELNVRDADAAREAGRPAPEPRRWILVSSTEATADEPLKNICRDVAARRLAALDLDFAYLRVCSAPASMDGRGLEESRLLPGLQLILTGRAARGGPESLVAWIEGDDVLFGFVRSLSPAVLDELEAREVPPGKTAVLASFQPGPLRQRLAARPDMRVLALPETLVKALVEPSGFSGAGGGIAESAREPTP